MKKKLEALKRAVDSIRSGKDPVKTKIKELNEEALALTHECLSRGRRAEKAEERAKVIEKIAGHTQYLVNERVAQKNRRQIGQKETKRGTRDEGLWKPGAEFKKIQKRRKSGIKLIAAQREIYDLLNGSISIKFESFCRKYRDWQRKRG